MPSSLTDDSWSLIVTLAIGLESVTLILASTDPSNVSSPVGFNTSMASFSVSRIILNSLLDSLLK